MIKSKLGQRLVGVGVLALSVGMIWWDWKTALTEGYYHNASLAFPAFAVFGLGAMVMPLDVEQLRAEHGVEKPEKFSHYPWAWKVLFFVALVAGFGNYYLLGQAVSP